MQPREGHPGPRGGSLPARSGPGRNAARPPASLPADAAALPALPHAYGRVLEDGLRDLGMTLEATVRRAVDDHVRLLLAWTQAINLTAVRDPAEAARVHVVDSLSGVPTLRRLGARRVLDIGTGGGMPGIPVALALPAEEALLVDSVGKKVRFLETVVGAVGAADRVSAIAARAEALAADPDHRERWDVVTARAVASLETLIRLALPLLRVGGSLVAWKRGDLDEELAAARERWVGRGVGLIDVVDPAVRSLPSHRLVVVTKDRAAGPPPRRVVRDARRRRR